MFLAIGIIFVFFGILGVLSITTILTDAEHGLDLFPGTIMACISIGGILACLGIREAHTTKPTYSHTIIYMDTVDNTLKFHFGDEQEKSVHSVVSEETTDLIPDSLLEEKYQIVKESYEVLGRTQTKYILVHMENLEKVMVTNDTTAE